MSWDCFSWSRPMWARQNDRSAAVSWADARPGRTNTVRLPEGYVYLPGRHLRFLGHKQNRRTVHEILAEHRPAAEQQRLPSALIVKRPPAVTWRHDSVTRAGVHRESGPPALPVLLIPRSAVAPRLSCADGLGDVIKARGPAAPAAPAALGETVPGQDPQRGGRRRRAQPGRPGHLGAARLVGVEHPVD